MDEEAKDFRIIDSAGKNVFDEDGIAVRSLNNLTASLDSMAVSIESMTEGFHDLSLSISNLTEGFNNLSNTLGKLLETYGIAKVVKKLSRKTSKRKKRR